MASQYRIERDRGTKEAPQQLPVLREKWPLAFPLKDQDIRPLAIAAASEIAAAMGWSRRYTLGVLRHWKMTAAYCQAILRHDQRIALDGAPTEAVGTEAKDLAAKQLAKLTQGREEGCGCEPRSCAGAHNRCCRWVTAPPSRSRWRG
jgi:sRNA-binding protein